MLLHCMLSPTSSLNLDWWLTTGDWWICVDSRPVESLAVYPESCPPNSGMTWLLHLGLLALGPSSCMEQSAECNDWNPCHSRSMSAIMAIPGLSFRVVRKPDQCVAVQVFKVSGLHWRDKVWTFHSGLGGFHYSLGDWFIDLLQGVLLAQLSSWSWES